MFIALEDFPKKDLKVVVLFYPPGLTIVNLRYFLVTLAGFTDDFYESLK